MIAYLIKFILCSGFLYSFYKLFLERESMYKINRFYLLFALIFALIAPFYKIHVPITAEQTNISPEILSWLMQNPELLEQENSWNFGDILNIIYLIIGIILLGRFLYNLYELMFKIKTEEKLEDYKITYILDLEAEQPYSFWKYIFIPKKQINDLHQNLIDHEKAHCIQKHSFDILLIEIFQIIFWFNPFVYFYKKSIKLNHEFLADEYVLMQNNDVKTYQHQILACIAAQNPSIMASHFNFILTKKRLLMMTKNTSKQKVKILSFATLPFILSAFVLFSQKTFAQKVEQNAQKVEQVLEKPVEPQAKLIFQIKPDKDTITQIGTFSINPKDSLKKINPTDIKSIDVNKKENFVVVTKKNNDTTKYYANSNFTPSDTKVIQIKNLKTNELLTEDLKKKLSDLHPKDIKTIDVRRLNGKKIVIINDSIEYNFDDKDIKTLGTYKTSSPKQFSGLIDFKEVIIKNGYSIYTDKNGVEHKIVNSKIDPIYFSKNNKNSTTDLQNQIKQLKFTEEITKNQIKELEKSVKKQKKNLNK